MHPVVSTTQIREIDRLTIEQYAVPPLELMENAASATVRVVTNCLGGDLRGECVLIVCGKGNNGGDGAATARLLVTAGANVDVILIGRVQDTKPDARTNFERLTTSRDQESRVDPAGSLRLFECDSEKGWEQLRDTILEARHDIAIDALFGVGLSRPVEGLHREAINYLNEFRRQRDQKRGGFPMTVSIDVPSGVNSDFGTISGEAVQADVTVTMSAPKRGNVLPPAAHCNGKLIVAEIGSPAQLINDASTELFLADAGDAQHWLIATRYQPESYKNTHGHALVIAGSRGFTGAAALCGNAAMRAGAGLVTVATAASVQPLLATQVLTEVMTTALAETDRGAVSDQAIDYALKFADRADVIGLGPGLSAEDERTRLFARSLVEGRRKPLVVDADGLNCLSPWPDELSGSEDLPIVLTPHPGEMLRLLGARDKSILNDRVSVARDFAVKHRLILVLKGSRTMIATPDGRLIVNPTGNAGLGTAGAGDTLTGVITGFLAQSYATLKGDANALETVVAAVYISGLAGDLAAQEIGMRAMTASDIREHLSEAFRRLDPVGERPALFV